LALQQPTLERTVMSRQRKSEDGGPLRGFARMEPQKQRELARKGGANVPSEKRSFSQNRALQRRREHPHRGADGALDA
jgi:general stress protein YciG